MYDLITKNPENSAIIKQIEERIEFKRDSNQRQKEKRKRAASSTSNGTWHNIADISDKGEDDWITESNIFTQQNPSEINSKKKPSKITQSKAENLEDKLVPPDSTPEVLQIQPSSEVPDVIQSQTPTQSVAKEPEQPKTR